MKCRGLKWESGRNIGTKSAFLFFFLIFMASELFGAKIEEPKYKYKYIYIYIYKLETIIYFKNLWFKKYVN